MSGKPAPLAIPDDVMQRVFHEARSAFPAECCGWLAGDKDGDTVVSVRPCANAQQEGDHPTASDRGAETAYVIAGDDLLDEALDDVEFAFELAHLALDNVQGVAADVGFLCHVHRVQIADSDLPACFARACARCAIQQLPVVVVLPIVPQVFIVLAKAPIEGVSLG